MHMYVFNYVVNFLILAASPIEAPHKLSRNFNFLQKVSYFDNLQLKPHGDFWDLSRTKTIFISYKKDNDQVFIKTAASYTNGANKAHAV